METIAVALPAEVVEAARRRAVAKGCTLEAYLRHAIERWLADADGGEDRILGLFNDGPELMDDVVESAMRAREERDQPATHH